MRKESTTEPPVRLAWKSTFAFFMGAANSTSSTLGRSTLSPAFSRPFDGESVEDHSNVSAFPAHRPSDHETTPFAAYPEPETNSISGVSYSTMPDEFTSVKTVVPSFSGKETPSSSTVTETTFPVTESPDTGKSRPILPATIPVVSPCRHRTDQPDTTRPVGAANSIQGSAPELISLIQTEPNPATTRFVEMPLAGLHSRLISE